VKSERRSAGHKGALRFLHDQRGAVAPLFAVLLVVLFGIAGLGVDVGIWYTLKRQYQSAADIAAISGAMELAAGKGQTGGPATADIQNLAQYAAWDNIPGGSATNPTVATGCTTPAAGDMCVNNPPLLGAFAGNDGYVEAIIGEPGPSIFPGFVGYGAAILIRTRAVAGLKKVETCMLALNTSGTDLGFNGGGSGAGLDMPNCAFVSDSTTCSNSQNKNSIVLNGNVTVNTGATDTSGCYTITGTSNTVSPPIVTGTPYQPDPYAALLPPPASTFPWNQSPPGPNLGCTNLTSGGTLIPGWYGGSCAGGSTPPMNLGGGTITVCPGVYYLDGESSNQNAALIISGTNTGTIVQMGTAGAGGCPANGLDGVTFIATCSTANCTSGGGFVIGGTGSDDPTVTLSAPCVSLAPGSPCPGLTAAGMQNTPGILLYQVASTADTSGCKTSCKSSTILAGAGSANLEGVIYAPATEISLQGNPSFGSCLELIAGQYSIGGTPSFLQPPTCNIKTASASKLVLAE
jgi:hypothetical protein